QSRKLSDTRVVSWMCGNATRLPTRRPSDSDNLAREPVGVQIPLSTRYSQSRRSGLTLVGSQVGPSSSDSVALLEGTRAVRLPRRAAHRPRRRVRGARTIPIDWMAPCGGGTRRLSFHVSPDPRIVVQYNVPAGQLG